MLQVICTLAVAAAALLGNRWLTAANRLVAEERGPVLVGATRLEAALERQERATWAYLLTLDDAWAERRAEARRDVETELGELDGLVRGAIGRGKLERVRDAGRAHAQLLAAATRKRDAGVLLDAAGATRSALESAVTDLVEHERAALASATADQAALVRGALLLMLLAAGAAAVAVGAIGWRLARRGSELGAHLEISRDQARHLLAATEAARAEAAASRERFEELARVVEDVFWIVELEQPPRCTYASPAYERIWGRTVGALRADFGERLEAVHPADRPRVEGELLGIARTGSFDCTYRITGGDGVERWVRDRGYLAGTTPSGAPRVCGIASDVTALVAAQEEGAASEARLRTLSATVPGLLFTCQPDGAWDYANEAFYEFTGAPPGAAAGDGWTVHLWPSDRERLQTLWHEHLASGRLLETELRLRRRDGAYHWFRVHCAPVRDADQRILQWCGCAMDMDAERRAREALDETEGRFRAISEAVEDVLWIVDPDGPRLLFLNAAFEALWQVPAAEVFRDYKAWLAVVHPEDRVRVLDTLAHMGSADRVEAEYRVVRPDGSTRWVHSRGSRMPDGCIAGVTSDVTDRVAQADALVAADRRKDDFIALLAHELRNPLGPIRNATQLLHLLAADEPRLARACDVIDRQVAQIVRLVDDLMDVSRISRGKIELERQPVRLDVALEQAVEQVRPAVEARQLRLVVSPAVEPLVVDADPTRLVQVIANLLGNACKFTEVGGHVTVSISRVEREAVLRVRDTGVGMSASLVRRVFDPFVQGDEPGDRQRGGLGIGLALVDRLVRLQGGTVTAHSDGPGHGSEFVVRLPLADSSAGTSPRARPPAELPTRALRILLVEDDGDAAQSLAALLELQGHEVRVACDGERGIDVAASFTPEVAIVDLGLEGIDGLEVARRLRRLPAGRSTVLVALSGYAREEDRQRSAAAGFDHHLAKPVEFEDVTCLLAELTVASPPIPPALH